MNLRCARVPIAAIGLVCIKGLLPNPSAAPANIIALSGSAREYHDPATVMRNLWESNRFTRVFNEQSGAFFKGALHVDITTTGRFDDPSQLTPGFIESGVAIDSYLLHQDPRGRRGHLLLSGSVRFDRDILGVIVTDEGLVDSDPLMGNPATQYPGVVAHRGLDF